MFTGVSEDEMYLGIPGDTWPSVAKRLIDVRQSNLRMLDFYTKHESRFAKPVAAQ